jgi:hypothetical protein
MASIIILGYLQFVMRSMLTRGLGSSTVGAVRTLWTMAGCDSEEDLHWGIPNA